MGPHPAPADAALSSTGTQAWAGPTPRGVTSSSAMGPHTTSSSANAQRSRRCRTLGSHQREEVTLAQIPGTSIELGSSRRDQRRRSSVLSAASSVARHYRPLDDDMEVAQDGL
jgi:hypothetical protein